MVSRFRLSLAAALLAASSLVHAQFYIGASAGRLHIEEVSQSLVSGVRTDDAPIAGDTRVEATRKTGGRVFGGYRFSRWWGLEAEYVDLGEISSAYTIFSAPINLPDNLTASPFGLWQDKARIRGYGISAVAWIPVSDGLSILARGGAARVRSEINSGVGGYQPFVDNITAPGVVQYMVLGRGANTRTVSQTRPAAGLGIDYEIAARWRVRAGWDRYFGVRHTNEANSAAPDKRDVDLYSVGFSFGF